MLENFSSRLFAFRKLRGMSQQDLGDKAGMSKAAISRYEKEKRAPSIVVLKLLCDALEVSASDLLGW